MRPPSFLLCGFVALLASAQCRADLGTLIFEDDFERIESQELKDEPGNGWGTNSKTRAKGNKQVDLKEGAMHIFIHKEADHAVSVTHPAEFKDGTVELRFLLEDKQDSLGLNFADLKYKAVHAGHLFMVKVDPKKVQINDLKTGNMDLKTRELRQAKKVPPELAAKLKTKTKSFPHTTKVGEWHTIRVSVDGETLSVMIDGETVGSFSSEGIAHPTKRTLRLSVPREVIVDDVKIYRRS